MTKQLFFVFVLGVSFLSCNHNNSNNDVTAQIAVDKTEPQEVPYWFNDDRKDTINNKFLNLPDTLTYKDLEYIHKYENITELSITMRDSKCLTMLLDTLRNKEYLESLEIDADFDSVILPKNISQFINLQKFSIICKSFKKPNAGNIDLSLLSKLKNVSMCAHNSTAYLIKLPNQVLECVEMKKDLKKIPSNLFNFKRIYNLRLDGNEITVLKVEKITDIDTIFLEDNPIIESLLNNHKLSNPNIDSFKKINPKIFLHMNGIERKYI